jgi:hypothetical protein
MSHALFASGVVYLIFIDTQVDIAFYVSRLETHVFMLYFKISMRDMPQNIP